jgi:two-component system, OmpR family, sensor histidine kinase TctE
VLEIARQHGAVVEVEDARPGQNPPGTRISVRFDGGAGEQRAGEAVEAA